MPYKLQASGSGWLVVNSDTGRPHSRKPLPRKRAEAQMRALYANVPDARTKEAGHTGVMLALFVPASALARVTALQEALPNPEPPEDLHLTLAYLGDSAALYYQRGDIERMLAGIDWVSFGLPLAGQIGGVGRFHHDEGDGTNAVYASFDAPGLPSFRQRLIDMLKGYGVMPAENHGFTPHITLAYVPTDAEVSTLPTEPVELAFGAVTLAWGDERIEFGPGALAMKATNFGARAGETIVGNLGRAGNGQFTTAGSSAKQPARATDPSRPATPTKQPASTSDPKRPATPTKQPASARDPQRPAAAARPRKARARTRAMQTNRRRVAAELKKAGTGVGPKSMAAMDAIRTRKYAEKLSPAHLATLDILKATGMVRKFEDGSFELTDAGKAFMEAADRGDTKAARAAISTKQPAKEKSLSVFKDAAGHWRWLTFSSTAFRDRDDEIVSTKALADDVARADLDGDYGPLRWWHTPGLDIGDCDFNAMHGRTLIESGTFRDERYGPLIAAKADELGVSIGFKHGPDQPDGDKVFHSIHRFERSLLPVAYPSNLYTALVVKENSTVDEKKIAGLKALGFGDDEIAGIQAQATAREKAAEAAGVTFKEAEAVTPEAPVEAAGDDTPEQVFFGDMTLDEAQAWLQQQNKPVLDALAGLSTATATKAASEQQTQTALKATHDALTQVQANQKAVDSKLDQALKSIAELQGDVPAGVKRASQDASTIATKEQVEAMKGPAADPMNDFLGFVTSSAG